MKKKIKTEGNQGETDNQTTNVKELLKKNWTMEQIIEYTGLTETEIGKIKAIQRKYQFIIKVVTCVLVIAIVGILFYLADFIIWFDWHKDPSMPGLGEMIDPIVDARNMIICLIMTVICAIIIKKIKQKL